MSVLAEYLAKKEEERRSAESSPEELLQRMVKALRGVEENTGVAAAAGSPASLLKEHRFNTQLKKTETAFVAKTEAYRFGKTDQNLSAMSGALNDISKILRREEAHKLRREAAQDKREEKEETKKRLKEAAEARLAKKQQKQSVQEQHDGLIGDLLGKNKNKYAQTSRKAGYRKAGGLGRVAGTAAGAAGSGFGNAAVNAASSAGSFIPSSGGMGGGGAKGAGIKNFFKSMPKGAKVSGALALLTAVPAIADLVTGDSTDKVKDGGKIAGSVGGGVLGGMAGGAAAGAAVGLFGGPLAPATVPIASAVGSIIGGIAGSAIGEEIGGMVVDGVRKVGDLFPDGDSTDKVKDGGKIAGAVGGGVLGGMAGGATAGAAVGLFGGPASPITVPVAAAVGSIIGGIATGNFDELDRQITEDLIPALAKNAVALENTVSGVYKSITEDLVPSLARGLENIESTFNSFVTSTGTFLTSTSEMIARGFDNVKDYFTTLGPRIFNAVKNLPATIAAVPEKAKELAKQGLGKVAGTSQAVADYADKKLTTFNREYQVAKGTAKIDPGAPKALGQLDMQAMSKNTYAEALATRESAGNYRVENKYGYMGAFQMGKEALQQIGYKDKAGNWTGKNGATSKEAFLNSKESQNAAADLFAKDNWKQLNSKPLRLDEQGNPVYAKDMVGKTINGLKITESGLLGAAHLGGAGSVKQFLSSNGQKIAVDANGVPITNYMTAMGNKDVSAATGNKFVDYGPVGAYQATGNEAYNLAGTKKQVAFANVKGNNDVNAQVAKGVKQVAVPTATAKAPTITAPVVTAARTEPIGAAPIAAPAPKAVIVANADAMKPQAQEKVSDTKVASAPSMPTLASVPMQIDDLGLMLLNGNLI